MVTRVGILQAKPAEPALRAVPGAEAVGQVCQSRQREPPVGYSCRLVSGDAGKIVSPT